MSLRIVRFSIVMLGLWLVIVVPWAWGDEAADQYAVAAGHYARGQWELAATEFGEFLRRFDADPRANQGRFFLAEALLQQGRPMEARKEFEEYLRRLPDGPHAKTARFRVGEAAYLAGRRKEARKDLEAFLAAYPDDLLNAYALPYLGDIALAEGNAGAAAEYYRRAIERFPSGPHAVRCRLGLGWALERLGEWDDADKQFDQVLASTSADRAWLDDAVLGKIQTALGLARLGQWDRAKSRIEPILAKHAGHPAAAPAVEQMAEAAYAAKNWPRAAEWFTWLAESSGQAVYVNRGLSGLAWTQFRQDHPADAAATFQRLLDRKPDPAVAARTAWARGYVLEQAGQHDAALASYRLALNAGEATPTTPMVLLAAARLHNKLKNYDEAAALYLRLATEYPKSAGLDAVLYEWSWALSDAGQAKEAADLLEQLHKEFPKTRYGTDAAYRLAEQAAADGDREAARRLVDELLESKSASAEIEQHALVLACRIDAADQRWDKVRDSAERLLKKHPDSSLHLVAEFWAAESLYRRDDYEKAAARLDRLMPEVQGRRETWTAMIPLRRAQIFAFDKQWKEAEERASTIQRDYPGFERQYEVDYLLGRCEAAQAEFSAARQAYRRAIQSPEGAKTETAAMAQWMIGETYFHQQNHEAALREYLRVEILYDFPRWQAAAVLQAGKCYERLNRPDEAAKQFRRVVEQYPVSPFVEEARNRLAAAAGPGKTSEAREAKRHPASAARRQ